MFKCFRLEVTTELLNLIAGYDMERNLKIVEEKKNIYYNLEKFIDKDHINLSNIESEWFEISEYDVFLSHSHKDIEIVNQLASWLTVEMNLKVFVDSYIWGYADDLIKVIDERYCKCDDGTYNYKKRNKSTSHVHVMLNNSIAKAMDKSECVIFLDTKNSLSMKSNVENGTSSEWIYSELLFTKLIEKKIPKRYKEQKYLSKGESLNESLNPLYFVDIKELIELNVKNLELAKIRGCIKGKNSGLDYFYNISKK
jgi:hypothetical protein